MTDQEWQKAMLEEEKKQTGKLDQAGCFLFWIALVVVGGAALSAFVVVLSFGATYSVLGR